MAEVWFYHLERRTVESLLPTLAEKALERGWRMVVQAGSRERVEALDAHLWTYSDDSFLPHGAARDGTEAEQPVFLTTEGDNPNGAAFRVMLDRAPLPEIEGYVRVAILFSGVDEEAREEARGLWRTLKAAGHDIAYWQEDERGSFVRRG